MNRKQFKQWLRRVYATVEAEMDCDKVQSVLPALVDDEIAGGEARGRFSAAIAHLAQCPDCAEEYMGLREAARLESQSHLPEAEESLNQFEEAPALERGELV